MNKQAAKTSADYVIGVLDSPLAVNAEAWNALLLTQSQPTPFMRHEFLSALHTNGCATAATGWTPRFFLLEYNGELVAACVLYVKAHSEGEFVFDWGWARAYHQHGLRYHPKAVCAVPFIPVPGSRLLARSTPDRARLVRHLLDWCEANQLTGLHGLFASDEDVVAFQAAGMLLRHTVQFHWTNTQPGYASFDDFLASLSQEKRKKIRQERRKVADAGVTFKVLQGREIAQADWDFFYHCYERTYLEHGNPPYFNRAFYASIAADMPEDWVLFIAEQHGQPIASSLLAINASCARATDQNDSKLLAKSGSEVGGDATVPTGSGVTEHVAYGRYWGALKRVDCLHFEACYYQPLQWCIEHGYQRFEGGAQGEHKLARALLPVTTTSAHWLAHPQFFAAVDNFLTQERDGISQYVGELESRSPFK
ncbi:GNAT family N-acetyltransferase [Rhodoferax antarcticus]|uniref:GNAT family N-acetyltransferase n=1 Tax=Rhodoferax antarcticus TaxID=81479 RepID=UPI0022244E79|nr:GNAT family N-acetyltransferase [Rhodoferax antarcticus]MCW2312468.1 putative N-acyltransferase [Rhodoferax antarcticus]